jgi:hypothetical protein
VDRELAYRRAVSNFKWLLILLSDRPGELGAAQDPAVHGPSRRVLPPSCRRPALAWIGGPVPCPPRRRRPRPDAPYEEPEAVRRTPADAGRIDRRTPRCSGHTRTAAARRRATIQAGRSVAMTHDDSLGPATEAGLRNTDSELRRSSARGAGTPARQSLPAFGISLASSETMPARGVNELAENSAAP